MSALPQTPDERRCERELIDQERGQVLARLQDWLEKPMLVLSLLWLALFVVEMLWGLNPLLEGLGTVIWGVFLLEFVVGFTLAPHKLAYLRHNWLKAVALAAPALRLLRFARLVRLARAARLARGARLLRVVSSLNRGMRALGASMGRRGLGYVVAVTLLVLIAGAAGMYAFENSEGQQPFAGYGDALWWTAMIMTTMGSSYWPTTAAGRILCVLLALYAFGVFGYVTASLATFFVGRDAEDAEAEIAGAQALADLREEIAGLRSELRAQRGHDAG